jgi:putative transposase
MKQTRFTEAQIVGILQEADANGVAIRDVCSRHGLSEQTFYRWRRRYGSMQVDEVKRLRELEAENARLKRLLAESALEIDAIREVLRGK